MYWTREKRMQTIVDTTPAFTSEHACPACNGVGRVPHVGEYETIYADGTRDCPLCRGSGSHCERLTIMQREALAIFNDIVPEEGMLYPTITPGELAKLRAGAKFT